MVQAFREILAYPQAIPPLRDLVSNNYYFWLSFVVLAVLRISDDK